MHFHIDVFLWRGTSYGHTSSGHQKEPVGNTASL